MTESEITVRWAMAVVLWLPAAYVLLFNLRRQAINRRRYRDGDDSRMSGISFLGTLFTVAGLGISPLPWHGWYWCVAVMEIPALINFLPALETDEQAADDEN